MPQFDMILLTPAQVEGVDVLEHTAGTPAREGGGDETYRCGSCKTKLLVNVAHHDAQLPDAKRAVSGAVCEHQGRVPGEERVPDGGPLFATPAAACRPLLARLAYRKDCDAAT